MTRTSDEDAPSSCGLRPPASSLQPPAFPFCDGAHSGVQGARAVSEDQHGIAVGVEAKAFSDGEAVGFEHEFGSGERAHQREQTRARQVEVGLKRIDGLKGVWRVDVEIGNPGAAVVRAVAALRFQDARGGRAHSDHAPPVVSGLVEQRGRRLRELEFLAVELVGFEVLDVDRAKRAVPDVQREGRASNAGPAQGSSNSSVKCRPAVGAATAPGTRAYTVW